MHKKIILLVDDEVITNVVHQHMLESFCEVGAVYAVTSGGEAMKLLSTWGENKQPLPDLIFVDLNMPSMTGFQFIEEIISSQLLGQSVFNNIIILSSSLHKTDLDYARSLGIQTYLEKPLTEDQIRECLNATGNLVFKSS